MKFMGPWFYLVFVAWTPFWIIGIADHQIYLRWWVDEFQGPDLSKIKIPSAAWCVACVAFGLMHCTIHSEWWVSCFWFLSITFVRNPHFLFVVCVCPGYISPTFGFLGLKSYVYIYNDIIENAAATFQFFHGPLRSQSCFLLPNPPRRWPCVFRWIRFIVLR